MFCNFVSDNVSVSRIPRYSMEEGKSELENHVRLCKVSAVLSVVWLVNVF